MEENIKNLVNLFEVYHECKPSMVVSCGGRFEVLGNHTDHNHGLCIASACNLEIIAAIRANKNDLVNLKSLGFPADEIDLSSLEMVEDEKGTSSALIRGVARYLDDHGYKVGGFLANTTSTIFKGAGISSSAAFEVLVGYIFNVLYNDGKIDKLTLCKAGQYAENVYYGKQCGMLDQIGVGYGDIVKIDFEDVNNPKIERFEFPFKDLRFLLVYTGGDHSNLSDLYSSIPQDMYSAANQMKVHFLRDASEEKLEEVKHLLNESEYLRTKHFYGENKRVLAALEAIRDNDEEKFLKQINESRVSSNKNLKNMMVNGKYEGSPLEACDLILEASENTGAVKINGGGFAGSVIAMIPDKKTNNVIKAMKKKYGEDNVKEIFIRKDGPITLYKLEK